MRRGEYHAGVDGCQQPAATLRKNRTGDLILHGPIRFARQRICADLDIIEKAIIIVFWRLNKNY